jgi:hypothetical protein
MTNNDIPHGITTEYLNASRRILNQVDSADLKGQDDEDKHTRIGEYTLDARKDGSNNTARRRFYATKENFMTLWKRKRA